MSATEVLLNTIINSSNRERREHPYLRIGQSIYNCTDSILPDIADALHGTEYDCFYNDTKIEGFLKEVARLFEGSIE